MKMFLTTLAVAAAISFPAWAEGDIHGSLTGEANASVKASDVHEDAFAVMPLGARAQAPLNARMRTNVEGGNDSGARSSAGGSVSGGAGANASAGGIGASAGAGAGAGAGAQ